MHWWILLAWTLFAAWVIFWDGADWLEGWLAGIVVGDWRASLLSATHLRLYVFFLWCCQLALALLHE